MFSGLMFWVCFFWLVCLCFLGCCFGFSFSVLVYVVFSEFVFSALVCVVFSGGNSSL